MGPLSILSYYEKVWKFDSFKARFSDLSIVDAVTDESSCLIIFKSGKNLNNPVVLQDFSWSL